MELAPNSKALQEALSIVQLTNICFKKCVVKSKGTDQIDPQLVQVLGQDPAGWLLTKKETVCVNNCAKSYDELKHFMHDQVLKDYSFVREKNRQTFEDL